MAVGDNAELFLTGAVAIRFDDNIFLDSANEQDDLIWSVTPGLDLVFGKGSATQGNAYYREEFLQYSDANDQDTSLSSLGVNSAYNGGKSQFDLSATYAQVSQNDNNVRLTGDLVRREVTHFHAKPEFSVTQKSSLAIGVTYDRTNYKPASFSDHGAWALPIDYYSEYSPKLDLSIGYRYRDNDISGTGIDSTDSFFNIGARGEFTPKLTGQVRVGFNQRDLDAGGDSSEFGYDADLTYAMSDKTSYRFNLSNDFGYAGTGESTKNFTLGLQASNKFTEQLSMNAGLSFRATEYPARDDDYYEGQIALTYIYNANVNFGASFVHRNNDSTLTGIDFSNNVFSFGANIRY